MMLDFSILTDDQLVDLIRAACAEAVRRGGVTRMAAEAAALDEAEKARIQREATERAIRDLQREEAAHLARDTEEKVKAHATAAKRKEDEEKIAKTWEYKDQIGAQITAILKPKREAQLKVWLQGADKRVYIGGGYRDNDVTYYHAGNHKYKPGTIDISCAYLHISRADVDDVKTALLPVLQEVCKRWNGITIPIPEWAECPQETL